MKPSCPTCSYAPPRSPLGGRDWYRRLHAWALSKGNARYDAAIRQAKRSLLGSLSGDVLEIGPGTGSSLRFYSPGTRWIGIEPNIHAHAYLQAEAERRGLVVDLRAGVAECLPLDGESVDAVVSTLVLCSVTNPKQVLTEIRRVLRPGGRFIFIEHVAAEHGTRLRWLQRLMRKPQALLGDGCRPDCETLSMIEAAGFSWIVHSREHMPVPLVGPHILGFAVR